MKTLEAKARRSRVTRAEKPANMGAFARKLDRAFDEIAERRVTVRHVEIPEPGAYTGADVKATRNALGVSVAVLAKLIGVSAKLVEHWEQGRRVPAGAVRRLLDEMNRDPSHWRQMLEST
jgi:DNA-binding transcriptional regulator YiaG